MSIQDWGAIGELLSAAAIFVTLIYLATQIKYARLTAMDINRTNRVVGIRDLNGVIATNADARAVCANWGYTHWAQYRSLKSSEDEEELKNIVKVWYSENPMSTLLSHDNFRAFFEADFVSWLDEIVACGD